MNLDKRQKKILRVSLKLFYEKGYAETTVRDIADKLKIHAPALYANLESKDDILVWICDKIAERFHYVMNTCNESGLEGEEKFRLFIKTHIEQVLSNMMEWEISWNYWKIADKKTSGKYAEILHTYYLFIKETCYNVIPEEQFGPHFHKDTAIFTLVQIINHVPKWAIKVEGNYETACIANEIADRFLYGYNK